VKVAGGGSELVLASALEHVVKGSRVLKHDLGEHKQSTTTTTTTTTAATTTSGRSSTSCYDNNVRHKEQQQHQTAGSLKTISALHDGVDLGGGLGSRQLLGVAWRRRPCLERFPP
jgi:hypothetical protein